MTDEHIINELKALEIDSRFVSLNIQRFSQKYAGQFVAVKDSQLIATGKSFEELVNKIKETDIDPSLVLIAYIPYKEEIIFY